MKTKIIATIGPSSSSKTALKKLIFAGVDVFRLNFSHGNHSEFERIIADIRELNRKFETHIPILADLQGPKIRIGNVPGGQMVLKKGDMITLTVDRRGEASGKIYVSYPDFPCDVRTDAQARVMIGGVLFPKKGVNLPDTRISLPSLSEKDKRDIRFILDHEIEWVGLSFVRSAKDIEELILLMQESQASNIPPVIAKIEKPEAVNDIDAILQVAHGVMVARGDLGVEVPLQTVPLIQKRIVKKCLQHSKPVIIATQMMEGMLNNSRPTRAEVNDVANSVMDGADALMLSGETSVGKFPVESVETMQKIISEVENFEDIYHKQHEPKVDRNPRFISDSIIYSGCNMARSAEAKAIVSVASSGYSTAKIASHRPKATIFAFAGNDFILRRMNLIWGVKPLYFDRYINTDQTIADLMVVIKEKGLVQAGDLIVHISNMPINEPGKSNMLKLSFVD